MPEHAAREAFCVEIRPYTEDESDPGFRRMGATTRRDAERIQRGADINLNHSAYYTRIVALAENTEGKGNG